MYVTGHSRWLRNASLAMVVCVALLSGLSLAVYCQDSSQRVVEEGMNV